MPSRASAEPPRKKTAKAAADAAGSEDTLKRERAGTYRTRDGRFTVEQSSSGWLLIDGEQSDELGLPLARGPFATLDEARAAISAARTGPRPKSTLAGRTSGVPSRPARSATESDRAAKRPGGASARTGVATERSAKADRSAAATNAERSPAAAKPALRSLKSTGRDRSRPAVVIRDIRAVDGEGLRELWREVGFRSIGDDDRSLARLARRNPGLVLVAAEGSRIVGSALGAWDGRRGWLYHVATAETHRRQGIATRLVDKVEAGLRDLGCPKVNVMVRDENAGGREFWSARGYALEVARQLSRRFDEG